MDISIEEKLHSLLLLDVLRSISEKRLEQVMNRSGDFEEIPIEKDRG